MEFLPQNKKTTIRYSILLAISVIGIIYINFFYNAVPKNSPDEVTPHPATGSPSHPLPGLLPYGAKLDLHILDLDKFKGLRSATNLSISQDELGKTNLFSR